MVVVGLGGQWVKGVGRVRARTCARCAYAVHGVCVPCTLAPFWLKVPPLFVPPSLAQAVGKGRGRPSWEVPWSGSFPAGWAPTARTQGVSMELAFGQGPHEELGHVS